MAYNYDSQVPSYQQAAYQAPPYQPPYQQPINEYQQQQEPIVGQTVSYGATASNGSNPFVASNVTTNPFATGAMSASYVQPAATDDYNHDVMKDQQNQHWQ